MITATHFACNKIFNSSGIHVPEKILKILRESLDIAIGGRPNQTQTFCNLEQFFEKWRKYAIKENVDKIKIIRMKGCVLSCFSEFMECYTVSQNAKELQKILAYNP